MKVRDELSISGEGIAELLKAVSEKGAAFRFRANGFSMSPFIKYGDVITVRPLSDTPLNPGDIAVFTHPATERFIVHRVVDKKDGSYLAKGDNIRSFDGFIPEKNILARVVRIERNGKRVLFGLGPERHLIAFLSRKKALVPLLFPLRIVARLFKRRAE